MVTRSRPYPLLDLRIQTEGIELYSAQWSNWKCGPWQIPPLLAEKRPEKKQKKQKSQSVAPCYEAASTRSEVLLARPSRSRAEEVPGVERSEPLPGEGALDEVSKGGPIEI